jgi:hypothetical protein
MGKRPNGTRQDAAGTIRRQAADRVGAMRSFGLHSLDLICTKCGHHTTFNVDEWPDEIPIHRSVRT